MPTPVDFWENIYRRASPAQGQPHGLAEELVSYLSPGNTVLELGCGDGRDALHFAKTRHHVIACDFSDAALRQLGEGTDALLIERHRMDITALPYPITTGGIDAVYARLSLHYFPVTLTREIFAEIARVLRPGGVFLGLFNSRFDAENGTGIRLEERYFELASGSRKRFFTAEEAIDLLGPLFGRVDSRYVPADAGRPEKQLVRIQAERLP